MRCLWKVTWDTSTNQVCSMGRGSRVGSGDEHRVRKGSFMRGAEDGAGVRDRVRKQLRLWAKGGW